MLARTLEPHQIVACLLSNGSCTVHAVTSQAHFFTTFKRSVGSTTLHLTTNAVLSPRNNSYLAIFHVLKSRLCFTLNYMAFVYEFALESPYQITAVARKPLTLPLCSDLDNTNNCGFIYTHSLIRFNTTHYIIGYGCNDAAGQFFIISAYELLITVAPIYVLIYSSQGKK